MESIQIRLTPELLKRVDSMVEKGMYSNRNEAVRDAVRRLALEYEALANTRKIRDSLGAKLRGKSGENLIKALREEEDRL